MEKKNNLKFEYVIFIKRRLRMNTEKKQLFRP
jgi:hypothetical protein